MLPMLGSLGPSSQTPQLGRAWGSQRGATLGRTFWSTSVSYHRGEGGNHHTGWEKAQGFPGGNEALAGIWRVNSLELSCWMWVIK